MTRFSLVLGIFVGIVILTGNQGLSQELDSPNPLTSGNLDKSTQDFYMELMKLKSLNSLQRPEEFRWMDCAKALSDNATQVLDKKTDANTKATQSLMDMANNKFAIAAQERNDLSQVQKTYRQNRRELQASLDRVKVDLGKARLELQKAKNMVKRQCQEQARNLLESRRKAIQSGLVAGSHANVAGSYNRSENKYSEDFVNCINQNKTELQEATDAYLLAHQALALEEKQIQTNLKALLKEAKEDQAMARFNAKEAQRRVEFNERMVRYTHKKAVKDTSRSNIMNQLLTGWGCWDNHDRSKEKMDRHDQKVDELSSK